MKISRLISVVVLLFGSLALTVSGQATDTPAKPVYDAALAAKLGADERGMKMYVMCFLKTGSLKVDDAKKRDDLMAGHFGMLNRLAAEGKLALVGPFSESGESRGSYAFDVKTIEEAQKLTETDPSINEGYFKVEFIKWYGSTYGLNTETELKMLRVIEELDQTHLIDLVPTFLAAHAVPREFKSDTDRYVGLICQEMLPLAWEWYAVLNYIARKRTLDPARTCSSA